MQPTLDPDILRSFIAIAETGGFTKAADRVHKTQSAVSMQIKRLEEGLGQSLFVRDGRNITLTPHGEILLDHARRILRAHQEAVAAFNIHAVQGHIKIGAPDDYASTFLPEILACFATSHPKVHVEIIVDTSIHLLKALKAGDVDLALITEGSGESGGVVVYRQPLVWVASASHNAQELDPVPLAAFHQGCCFRKFAIESLAASGRAHRIAYTSLSVAGINAALDAGLAIAVMLKQSVRTGHRILTEAEGFAPLPEIGIGLHRSPQSSGQLVERLEQHLIECFRADTFTLRAA